jgi:hypothetical protein
MLPPPIFQIQVFDLKLLVDQTNQVYMYLDYSSPRENIKLQLDMNMNMLLLFSSLNKPLQKDVRFNGFK